MLLDIGSFIRTNNIDVRGIIHVGAHHGEEAAIYNGLGIEKVVWIEANPMLIDKLKDNVQNNVGHKVFNYAISEEDNIDIELIIGANSQTSSVLEFSKAKYYHPDDAVEVDKFIVKSIRLDTMSNSGLININHYNVLVLDIQGAELLALKSLGDFISGFDLIYTEINLTDHYKDCALLSQIDAYLGRKGFLREQIQITRWHWGDAIYFKRSGNWFKNYFHSIVMQLKISLNVFIAKKLRKIE